MLDLHSLIFPKPCNVGKEVVTPFCEMKEFIVSALVLEFCFLCFAASCHSYYGSHHSLSEVLLLLFMF